MTAGPRPGLTPGDAFRRLRGRPRPFWLDAASDADGLGRYSFVGSDPDATLARAAVPGAAGPGDAFAALEAAARAAAYDPGVPGPCPVWVGALGYDLRHLAERGPARHPAALALPDLSFARYPAVLRYDHATGTTELLGRDPRAVAALAARLDGPAPRRPAPPFLGPLRPDLDRAAYTAAVARILAYLRAGDVYEVCYAHRLRAALHGDPAGLYLALRAVAPAPLGAFLDLDGAQLLSNSPELFLAFDPATRRVESRPIKGTRPRGASRAEDDRRRRALHADPKEIAEHVMIVDLVRNDLGRVATVGSVTVSDYGRNVALPTVHHRVSTVAATVRPEVGLAALLRATFPGGSVTGAPKVRAMEIIDELEAGRRGPYCGAFGFVGARGETRLAMAIRTGVVVPAGAAPGEPPRRGAAAHELHLHVGGAIVADSDPAREHAETEAKAAAFHQAVARLGARRRRPRYPPGAWPASLS